MTESEKHLLISGLLCKMNIPKNIHPKLLSKSNFCNNRFMLSLSQRDYSLTEKQDDVARTIIKNTLK